jgi:hypothetical protein
MTFFGAALLTAVTTAVLAFGAIFAAVFAVLAFRAQSRQLDLQQRRLEVQREDSTKHAEVLELQAAVLTEFIREALERREAQEAMVHAWTTTEDSPDPAKIFARVKNISGQALYDVILQWWPEPGFGPMDEEECARIRSVAQLMPGEDLSDSSGTLGPYACWSAIFRDHAGVCWRVHPNERPRKVGENKFPGATTTPAAAVGGGSRRVR